MSCEFGHLDCKNEGIRCDLCFNELHYVAKQVKSTGLVIYVLMNYIM